MPPFARALVELISQLRILHVRFALDAVDTVHLPGYKGSALRGGFGRQFRQTSCTAHGTECSECLLNSSCPYGYCFETSGPARSELGMWGIDSVPRPFVLVPPAADGPDTWHPGEKLSFDLILIGRGTAYLPYFVAAFHQLGTVGIGAGRGRFNLSSVTALSPNGEHTIYPLGGGLAPWLGHAFSPIEPTLVDVPTKKCLLTFHTMTRLRAKSKLQEEPAFVYLVQSALARLTALAYVHHGIRPTIDWQSVIKHAELVRLAHNNTHWQEWGRFSTRQRVSMNMGGIIGTAVYEGDITPLTPLLQFAQHVHIGKNTTFGLGAITWQIL